MAATYEHEVELRSIRNAFWSIMPTQFGSSVPFGACTIAQCTYMAFATLCSVCTVCVYTNLSWLHACVTVYLGFSDWTYNYWVCCLRMLHFCMNMLYNMLYKFMCIHIQNYQIHKYTTACTNAAWPPCSPCATNFPWLPEQPLPC